MRHISLAYDMSTFWNGNFNPPAKTHTRARAQTHTATLIAIGFNDVIIDSVFTVTHIVCEMGGV